MKRLLNRAVVLLALCCLTLGRNAFAEDGLHVSGAPPGSVVVAEGDGDDSYDPFADYSEFQEAADEEEDVNFFKNGRLLTLGFIAGYRGFTGDLAKIYKGGGADFGLTLSYFFDLRFALQIGYQTSDHTLNIPAGNNGGTNGQTPYAAVDGASTYSDISVNLKYYFNTQNVTRGLANLNPYLIVGFSQVYLTTTRSDIVNFYGKDAAFGANAGVGIEIPMLRNKMYFGAQAVYNYINLPNQGAFITDGSNVNTPYKMSGGAYTGSFVLGANF